MVNYDYSVSINDRFNEVVPKSHRVVAPCVMYALKAHLINHDKNLVDREKIMESLTKSQRHKGYSDEAQEAMLKRDVKIPKELRSKGITLNDISRVERVNRIPIAVYKLN